MVDPEVCQGFTTDEAKAALRNIHPTKAEGPDNINARFQQHLGPFSISLLTSILKIVGGEQSPSRMMRNRHQTNTKRREGPTEDGELSTCITHVDRKKNDGAPGHQPSTIFCRIDAPVNRIPSSVSTWPQQIGPTAPIVFNHK